jgi:hypothetical protein
MFPELKSVILGSWSSNFNLFQEPNQKPLELAKTKVDPMITPMPVLPRLIRRQTGFQSFVGYAWDGEACMITISDLILTNIKKGKAMAA